MNITLRHLRYAIGISRHRTLAAAAEALHVSQPALSLALAQIEREMGHSLFVRRRGGPGLFPTPFGRRFIANARAVLLRMNELEVMTDERNVRGEMTLGCFEDLAPFCLAPVMAECASLYPELQIDVVEGGFDALAERLSSGELDMAVSYDVMLPNAVERRPLCPVTPWAILPQDHPLAGQQSVRLEDMAGYQLILTGQIHSAQHFLTLFGARGIYPERTLRIGTFELQRSMIAHGLGIGLAYTRPRSLLSYDGKPLVYRPIDCPEATHRIVLAISSFAVADEAVEAIAKSLTDYFVSQYQTEAPH